MSESDQSKTAAAKPPEPRNPTTGDRAVAGLVSIAAGTLRLVPAWAAYAFADCLAPILAAITKRRERRIGPLGRGMIRNQRIVFRDSWTEEQSKRHQKAWARHMCHSVVDFMRMTRITPDNVGKRIDLSELEQIRELQSEGKGVICASGHLGVWELCGHAICLSGMRAVTVYRPPSNPLLDAVFGRIRRAGGQELVTKWGALFPLAKALRRGAITGIAADENDAFTPTFVPFLGTLAGTNATPALLASRTGAPIAVISCHRTGKGKWKFHVWDVIRVERSPDADLPGITAKLNAALSQAILAYPEQWLWGSRRFMTRPSEEVFGDDGLPPLALGCQAADFNAVKLSRLST